MISREKEERISLSVCKLIVFYADILRKRTVRIRSCIAGNRLIAMKY